MLKRGKINFSLYAIRRRKKYMYAELVNETDLGGLVVVIHHLYSPPSAIMRCLTIISLLHVRLRPIICTFFTLHQFN